MAQPPETPVRTVVDTYHGVEVSDPYRWLEDDADDEVRRWNDAQSAYARSVLDNLPNVAAIRARVTEIMSDQSPDYWSVTRRGPRYFAMKSQPPKQQPMLVVLTSLSDLAGERVLVDPGTIDASGATTIDWYVASPDGSHVAVSMSVGGTEAGDVHVFDAATGSEVFEVVPHASSGTAGGDLAWAPDGRGFYYTRHPWPGERPEQDRGFYQQVYYHALGTPAADDRYELGAELPRIAEIELQVDNRTGRVLATVQNGDGGEFAHFLRSPAGTWQQFSVFGDRTVQALFGPRDDLFLVSLRDAPRGQLQHIEIAELGRRAPDTIVPQGPDTIVTSFFGSPSIVATQDRLYVEYQLGGPSEIRAFDHRGRPAAAPELPSPASVSDMEPLEQNDLLFGSDSYLRPYAIYVFRAEAGVTEETALASLSPVNFDDVEVARENAVSADGTRVPVNIMFRRGLVRDGSNPCIVTGYGGYGLSLAPRYRELNRILLDHGVVFAEANLRGGGEFGESWHLEGNLTNKQNVFDDFAAVLRHMIERGYTSSDRLAIVGGSNGGLLMGAILTQHPELVKAAVSSVGIYDMLRVELSPNGEFNITEFGTVKNPDHFRALHAYSPYHRVQDGVHYPAVLMPTGANDPRVEPMQSRKMVARLQAATAGNAPILLRASSSSGHGGDTPLSERIEQAVDTYAFLFAQLGIDFVDAAADEGGDRAGSP